MKTEAIVPATFDVDAVGIRLSAAIDPADAGGHTLFLAGNDLPGRWQGRDRYTVLSTCFGRGHTFLATWDAWRNDPRRCARLSFVAIEHHPPTRDALASVPREATFVDLAQQLVDAWPPLTPNLHRLSFEDGRIELLLALGDMHAWLPQLTLAADAFYLDDFALAHNPPRWDTRVAKALGRLAAPGATLVIGTAATAVRADLASAGFALRPDAGSERDITFGRYAPQFTPRRSPGRASSAGAEKRALVVGGGLAGAATAWALAERGWQSVLFERHATLAAEASGNPGGIFHGTLHRQDGPHARLHRAGALAAAQAVRIAIRDHGAAGAVDGLLRLEASIGLGDMTALIRALGLPADYVRAVDSSRASELAGIPLEGPAWHYPGGGWVQPAGLIRSFVARAGAQLDVRLGASVDRIVNEDGRWRLFDAVGRVLDEAETLVLANAGDALRLLGHPAWPLAPVRGQISLLPVDSAPAGLRGCVRPVAGAGYLLPATSAQALLFGATSQPGDADPRVREADNTFNLAQLARLTALGGAIDPNRLTGRTGCRWVAVDRLPLIGAVPERSLLHGSVARTPGWDQPRRVPRAPGLFVFIGLGSRGIGWSALGAQTLAAAITAGPWPLEADLADAIDPARFMSRAQRRSQAAAASEPPV